MLARWKKPSAWDRLNQDDPLAPLKGEWVPDPACNTTASGTVTLHLPDSVVMNLGNPTAVDHFGTSYMLGNQPPPEPQGTIVGPLPYARNRHERRILASLGDKLRETVKKVEKKIGKRYGTKSVEAWNAAFWELVTLPKRPGRPV
jgi:hypothetical protein